MPYLADTGLQLLPDHVGGWLGHDHGLLRVDALSLGRDSSLQRDLALDEVFVEVGHERGDFLFAVELRSYVLVRVDVGVELSHKLLVLAGQGVHELLEGFALLRQLRDPLPRLALQVQDVRTLRLKAALMVLELLDFVLEDLLLGLQV